MDEYIYILPCYSTVGGKMKIVILRKGKITNYAYTGCNSVGCSQNCSPTGCNVNCPTYYN